MTTAQRHPTQDERADAAYLAYLEAKTRADRTLLLRDMAAAVHAWNAFIDLGFTSDKAREDLRV